ncbi:hypothetical protein SLS62_004249 [Diatrype stigma]|uniref:F-box domain-containing protein n=1 Tax=Diatrype stigma TaxID=117547 RepID=A0AAN9UTS5_9PEZI
MRLRNRMVKATTSLLTRARRSQASRSNVLMPKPKWKLTARMPPELLWMICECVENQHDLHALMLTCRTFFKLARPLLIWKNAHGQREALHWACVHGHVKTLSEMLEAEAHTNPFNLWVLNRRFSTPMNYVPLEQVRSMERKALLPQARESVVEDSYSDAIQNLRTPLHIAAAWHHVEVVQTLIATGVRALFRPKDRRAPRKLRVGRYHYFDAIDWAITPNPLILDVDLPREAGKVCKMIRILLADLPIVRKDYFTYCCDRWLTGDWSDSREKATYVMEIIKTLIDMGASPRDIVSGPKRSYLKLRILREGIPMMDSILYHASLEKPENLRLFKFLYEHGGGNVNGIYRVGFSTIHLCLAVTTRNTALVDWLLEKGANPDVVADDGRNTPLHTLIASSGSRVEIARQLIQAGANINLRDTIGGLRPMELCLKREIWDVASLLMMVDMGKRFADRNIFHEERAWNDPQWLKFVRVLIDNWFDNTVVTYVLPPS